MLIQRIEKYFRHPSSDVLKEAEQVLRKESIKKKNREEGFPFTRIARMTEEANQMRRLGIMSED